MSIKALVVVAALIGTVALDSPAKAQVYYSSGYYTPGVVSPGVVSYYSPAVTWGGYYEPYVGGLYGSYYGYPNYSTYYDYPYAGGYVYRRGLLGRRAWGYYW